jgi:hypothetical protein
MNGRVSEVGKLPESNRKNNGKVVCILLHQKVFYGRSHCISNLLKDISAHPAGFSERAQSPIRWPRDSRKIWERHVFSGDVIGHLGGG